MSDFDALCHPKHEPINIDSDVRDRLRAFLGRSDVPRGMGYTAFIEWALRQAEDVLAPCVDGDGSGYCEVHLGWDRDFVDDEDYTMHCDMQTTLDI